MTPQEDSPAKHPALGIDFGDVRIGVAATDEFGILAYPVEVIDQSKSEALPRLADLVATYKIKTVIVGLPLRLDGSEGSSAKKVRSFTAHLRERISPVPVVLVDESLTTVSAAEKLREAGKNSKSQKALIDQAAAVEILNLWMDES